jgi:hypothetical protein
MRELCGSALAQAFCWSLDDPSGMWGGWVASKAMGGHIGITICEKSPPDGAVMAAGKVAILRHAILAIIDICKTAQGELESFLMKKKLQRGINNLKTLRSEAQNRQNRPSPPPLRGNH